MESASHNLQLQRPVPQVWWVVGVALVEVVVVKEEELRDLQLQESVVLVLHFDLDVPFRHRYSIQRAATRNDQCVVVIVVQEP